MKERPTLSIQDLPPHLQERVKDQLRSSGALWEIEKRLRDISTDARSLEVRAKGMKQGDIKGEVALIAAKVTGLWDILEDHKNAP